MLFNCITPLSPFFSSPLLTSIHDELPELLPAIRVGRGVLPLGVRPQVGHQLPGGRAQGLGRGQQLLRGQRRLDLRRSLSDVVFPAQAAPAAHGEGLAHGAKVGASRQEEFTVRGIIESYSD